MLNIFICEDNLKQREELIRHIENYIMIEQLDMRVMLATNNPDEVIQYVKNHDIMNGLYFLDIDLQHEKTGIVLGAEIRKYDPRGVIVFVTTHSELTYLTFMYKVEALDFIIKDDFTNIKQRVNECLTAANERLSSINNDDIPYVQIKTDDKIINADCRKVLFFETSSTVHKVIMHTKTRSVEFYGKLKDIVKLYPNFYRCHHSYVVNIDNISSIDRKTRDVILTNGATCKASTRYMKGILNKLEGKN